jgi:Transmembrane protein 33/Nucleoporin POM33
VQLPVFAIFLRYKYFNSAYTRNSLRELSGSIDSMVNPLPPVVRDTWFKIRDAISYYATRPLVAGEGVPAPNAAGAQASGARNPSGTQRRS